MIANILLSILYTIGTILLYTLIFSIILLPFYYLGYFLFKKFENKLTWTFAALLSSYIVSYLAVIIVFFAPYLILGYPLSGLSSASNWFVYILYHIGIFAYYAFIFAIISQVFIFFGSYLFKKFKYESAFINTIITILIISLILNVLNILFPWILGGLLIMIYG